MLNNTEKQINDYTLSVNSADDLLDERYISDSDDNKTEVNERNDVFEIDNDSRLMHR